MAYCTQTDLEDRFGLVELTQLTDRDGAGAPDPAVVARAIADAEAEVDSYLRGRVTLPLSPVPPEVTAVACDIARYRLYGVRAPEEVRRRYEDARGWLRDVAAGRVVLVREAEAAPVGVAVEAPEAVFTADALGRMPG